MQQESIEMAEYFVKKRIVMDVHKKVSSQNPENMLSL
jgi:hypothetical protein